MNNATSIPSIVNDVYINKGERGIFVRKVYLSTSKVTGIAVNMRRSEIELNVIRAIRSDKHLRDVRVPKVISSARGVLETEVMPGVQLASHSSSKFASIDEWKKLGGWLARTEYSLMKISDTLFDGLFDVQAQSRAVMNSIKTPNIPKGARISVSLGDVGLSNTLWDGTSFAALDFEFCHLSSPGRDIAQLCAQIISSWPDSISNAVKPLQDGYQQHGGVWSEVEFWISNFLSYYTSKRG